MWLQSRWCAGGLITDVANEPQQERVKCRDSGPEERFTHRYSSAQVQEIGQGSSQSNASACEASSVQVGSSAAG